jgi:hypothetical protein
MNPMFLPEVEQAPPQGAYAVPIEGMRAEGKPVPQMMHLFATEIGGCDGVFYVALPVSVQARKTRGDSSASGPVWGRERSSAFDHWSRHATA